MNERELLRRLAMLNARVAALERLRSHSIVDLLHPVLGWNGGGGGSLQFSWLANHDTVLSGEGMSTSLDTHGIEPQNYVLSDYGGYWVALNGTNEWFGGSDDRFAEPDDDEFLGFIYCAPDNITSDRVIICKADSSGDREWRVRIKAAGAFEFSVSDTGAAWDERVTCSLALTVDHAYFVAWYYEPSTQIAIWAQDANEIELPDADIEVATVPADIDGTNGGFAIGSYGDGGDYFDGKIGAGAFWFGVPSGSEADYVRFLFHLTRPFYGLEEVD